MLPLITSAVGCDWCRGAISSSTGVPNHYHILCNNARISGASLDGRGWSAVPEEESACGGVTGAE